VEVTEGKAYEVKTPLVEPARVICASVGSSDGEESMQDIANLYEVKTLAFMRATPSIGDVCLRQSKR
jgi:hypothetical protein